LLVAVQNNRGISNDSKVKPASKASCIPDPWPAQQCAAQPYTAGAYRIQLSYHHHAPSMQRCHSAVTHTGQNPAKKAGVPQFLTASQQRHAHSWVHLHISAVQPASCGTIPHRWQPSLSEPQAAGKGPDS
jgi:hypothetical protein